MQSRPLMTLRLTTAPTQDLGAAPDGAHVIFPITGGSFEGDRMRGKVLPSGDDWTVKRADGIVELDMRVTLATDDGALVYNGALGHPSRRRTGSSLLSNSAALRDGRAEIRLLEPTARRRDRERFAPTDRFT